MEKQTIHSTIGSLNYKLDDINFDGPLDLLYEMVKQSDVDIRNIFITDIIDQFVAYVRMMKDKDYDYVSEFIAYAAHLVELKSYSLVSDMDSEPDYGDDSYDPAMEQEQVFSQLETKQAYERTLQVALDFQAENETFNRFYAEPRFDDDESMKIIKNFDIDKMIVAFSKLIEKAEFTRKRENKNGAKTIIKERFTVSEKVRDMAKVIVNRKRISFYTLFDKDFTKSEIINTFLALLELLKRQVAKAKQAGEFTDIDIVLNEEFDVNRLESEEFLTDGTEEHN